MATSMLDQMLIALRCGHEVVLGRLEDQSSWKCERCGSVTNLSASPHKELIDKYLETARDIDNRKRENGETVVRAG